MTDDTLEGARLLVAASKVEAELRGQTRLTYKGLVLQCEWLLAEVDRLRARVRELEQQLVAASSEREST
jgi:Viral A-type inclusion protein repeat